MIPKTYNTYIEPFIGSGCIFLSLQPNKWIINDINVDLISLWMVVKDNPLKLIEHIKRFSKVFVTLSLEGKKKKCQDLSTTLNSIKPGIKRSAYFLLLKFCAYIGVIMRHGVFVFSGIGHEYLKEDYTPAFFQKSYFDNIQTVSAYLQNGIIMNTDYKNVLKLSKRNDFVFLDPPYIEDHDYQFNYNKNEVLDNRFITDLLKEVRKLDKRGVKWLMTLIHQ